ncbi:hypothetical protein PAXRUDRAFT_835691 [Paxillus rubicundulus Ve08.2h10]|uniref:Uncharacterized protein n=1 Tax=Paxillus rubicundulus Ve08.2h10 TaxID=930991 RepID=A0A0D0CJM0_9AGAM|nr:hypothetical protein PAXRUDRAFT_835691 [Paxillus rubicundulus Ve08.2h10]
MAERILNQRYDSYIWSRSQRNSQFEKSSRGSCNSAHTSTGLSNQSLEPPPSLTQCPYRKVVT